MSNDEIKTPDTIEQLAEQAKKPDEVKINPYHMQLITQWYKTGHTGNPPIFSDGKGGTIWTNRKERKARESQQRKYEKKYGPKSS